MLSSANLRTFLGAPHTQIDDVTFFTFFDRYKFAFVPILGSLHCVEQICAFSAANFDINTLGKFKLQLLLVYNLVYNKLLLVTLTPSPNMANKRRVRPGFRQNELEGKDNV